MTFKDNLIEMEMQNGLFEAAAKEIMESVIKEDLETDKLMADRWNDTAEDYPPTMTNALWAVFKRHALKWIDKNAPQHWARDVFVS